MPYRKELFVFDRDRPARAVIRNYAPTDFAELIEVQREAFPPPYPEEALWTPAQLANHVRLFPDGAICTEVEGRIVGSVTGMIVAYDLDGPDHPWGEVTGWGTIDPHDPDGDTLYIVDICVRPSARKLGLGKQLMAAMYELVIEKRLKRLLGGGRMPGYHAVAERLSAQAYLDAVTRGEIHDPVVTFLLRCGRMPVRVVADYLADEESRNYGALMEWRNPFKAST